MASKDIESQDVGSSRDVHDGTTLSPSSQDAHNKIQSSPKRASLKRFSIGMEQGSRSSKGTHDGLPQHRKSAPSRDAASLAKNHSEAKSNVVKKSRTMPAAPQQTGSDVRVANAKVPQKSATILPRVASSDEEGYTIFKKSDRPELQTMESYVVGARSPLLRPGSLRIGSKGAKGMPLLPIGIGKKARHNDADRAGSRTPSQDDGILRRPSSKGARQSQSPVRARQSQSPERQSHSTANGAIPTAASAAKREMGSPTKKDALGHGEERSGSHQDGTRNAQPIAQKLSDLHQKYPHLKTLQKPILPLVNFPGQGAGKMSEFAQEAPLWSRQPYKILYLIYFGLSIGLIFLPWFALKSLVPSQRPKRSWTWKRSTLVQLYRHGTRLTFRTHTSLSRDLTKEVPHSKTIRGKFVWIDPLEKDLIRGELRRMMTLQGLVPRRTCGFWYGERDDGGGVGQQALPNEKVVFHLHGGAYWIGTAHEKDVTAAVNMQVLKALDGVYKSKSRDGRDVKTTGLCKRTFSVDYRLCVPGKPEAGSFPAPLLDALAAYRYLLHRCNFEARNIIVAGDSAGGNLGLALCRYLRDEGIDEMPGALILLSPWADTSRSHSGPTSSPNKFSTVYTNRKTDIISPSLAFRNTAVSALLGKMEARETYKNPYLSSCSLQLESSNGGAGPSWGYEGFPKKIYICTGTAEISHDQHLTLAYRLAGGSQIRVPVLADGSDESCLYFDPYETAARLNYPRPHDHAIMLWPSAQNTPLGTPLEPPRDGWAELQHESSRMSLEGEEARPQEAGDVQVEKEAQDAPDRHTADCKEAAHASPKEQTEKGRGLDDGQLSKHDAGMGNKTTKVKERDTLAGSNVTKMSDMQGEEHVSGAAAPSVSSSSGKGFSSAPRQLSRNASKPHMNTMRKLSSRYALNDSESHSAVASSLRLVDDGSQITPRPANTPRFRSGAVASLHSISNEEEYFAAGGEDRVVTLDVCKDGVHDYTLFDWFEPERGQTWARIAQWIDEEL